MALLTEFLIGKITLKFNKTRWDRPEKGFTEPIRAACKEKDIEYKGCFDCQGALTESLHKVVQKKLNLNDEQWADMVKQMSGRPNESAPEGLPLFQ